MNITSWSNRDLMTHSIYALNWVIYSIWCCYLRLLGTRIYIILVCILQYSHMIGLYDMVWFSIIQWNEVNCTITGIRMGFLILSFFSFGIPKFILVDSDRLFSVRFKKYFPRDLTHPCVYICKSQSQGNYKQIVSLILEKV